RKAAFPQLSAEHLLTGALHNRLALVLLKQAGLVLSSPLSALTEKQLTAVCGLVKDWRLPVLGVLGFDAAQVTAGGVLTRDFHPETLESRITPGLYACGEVLDIDGDCGGFNLQWAWSSGHIAGAAAAGLL
ncbi:MAG: NAD(P)/FAD-dependent oxidoreductase, partial [Firmicutes bacterium]|nr:NAD(P)/FAD-dependent oxidoreductase [Bacillota bacterium]